MSLSSCFLSISLILLVACVPRGASAADLSHGLGQPKYDKQQLLDASLRLMDLADEAKKALEEVMDIAGLNKAPNAAEKQTAKGQATQGLMEAQELYRKAYKEAHAAKVSSYGISVTDAHLAEAQEHLDKANSLYKRATDKAGQTTHEAFTRLYHDNVPPGLVTALDALSSTASAAKGFCSMAAGAAADAAEKLVPESVKGACTRLYDQAWDWWHK
ncbi:unnamed protein product [Vitrella brassicaformis CCMP3155]|uniref:Uncharacterized protein n=2 Tax=Vitrella brassicaformis TaxID=1169539 RepID=A0A0G4ESH1_VITBC|nr:unnamed protein product [Vitrella brassicaformis CCMP3155]|eukprot:CEM00631.1 unnamed protein product [Vitrella brassicaformis CCMP3155]